ncbi:EamA family transporter [Polaromonas sp. P1(28)-8]|nr:EamA family transporter [Polaromonas sp. P1(28)-8]
MEKFKIVQALMSVVGISLGQLLLKMAAMNLHNPDALGFWLAGLRINAHLISGVAVLGCSTLLWVWVLRGIPLSIAYPFMALAFIFVPVLSFYVLGEPLGWRQAAGGLMIALGVIIVSS